MLQITGSTSSVPSLGGSSCPRFGTILDTMSLAPFEQRFFLEFAFINSSLRQAFTNLTSILRYLEQKLKNEAWLNQFHALDPVIIISWRAKKWGEMAKIFLRTLKTVIYLILFLSFFFEFPSNFRPPCTTMPWTIWPALVVLWGVCWMFQPPETGSADGIFGQATDYDFLELYPSE